jgi:hypothetical protein
VPPVLLLHFTNALVTNALAGERLRLPVLTAWHRFILFGLWAIAIVIGARGCAAGSPQGSRRASPDRA